MGNYNLDGLKHHILVCKGSSCKKKRADEVTAAVRQEIRNHNMKESIHLTRTGCLGRCPDACNVVVYPEGTWYKEMTPKAGRKLIEKLVQNKQLKKNVAHQIQGKNPD